MKTVKQLFCGVILLWTGFPLGSDAQQPLPVNKNQSEPLQQEVSTALADKGLLKADVTWIKSKHIYPLQFAPVNPSHPSRGSVFKHVPNYARSKTKITVIQQSADKPTQFVFSSSGKDVNAATADLLGYAGDPFIFHFRQGFPKPDDSNVYIGGLRYGGTETKDGAVYRVLEAQTLIVSSPRTDQQAMKAGFVVPLTRFEVINWKWYIGTDGLVHRLTWENHAGVGTGESIEQNEIIVNKIYPATSNDKIALSPPTR